MHLKGQRKTKLETKVTKHLLREVLVYAQVSMTSKQKRNLWVSLIQSNVLPQTLAILWSPKSHILRKLMQCICRKYIFSHVCFAFLLFLSSPPCLVTERKF